MIITTYTALKFVLLTYSNSVLFSDCISKTEVFFSVPVLFKSDRVKTLLANISQGTKSVLAACAVRRSEDGSGPELRVHW